jgi:group I intron endonuclease
MPFKTKLSGIYKIHRIGTTDCYVGQALNIYSRWCVHLHKLRAGKHHSLYLQNAFLKYGEAAFSFEIIELFDPPANIDLLTIAEQKWIDTLQPIYNMFPVARNRAGFSLSPETRAKMSAAKKGRPLSEANRLALSAAQKIRCKVFGLPPQLQRRGFHLSAVTRARISAASKGKSRPRASAETRAKMSASRLGKKGTMLGKRHSQETRAKMRESHLKRYAEMAQCSQRSLGS